MAENVVQHSKYYKEYKRALKKFSDEDGGIKFSSISSFCRGVGYRTKLIYIEEAIRMLINSEDDVIQEFLDDRGWKIIDKWLLKSFRAQEASDQESAARVQRLIFQIINRWLSKTYNTLREGTRKIIGRDWPVVEENRKMIQEFRTKWEIKCRPMNRREIEKMNRASEASAQSTGEPIFQRLRNFEQSSEHQMEVNDGTSQPYKQSRTGIEDVPSSSTAPAGEAESDQPEDENLETGQVNCESTLHGSSREDFGSKWSSKTSITNDEGDGVPKTFKYQPKVIDHSRSPHEPESIPEDKEEQKEDSSIIYYRRRNMLNRNSNDIRDIAGFDSKKNQNVTIHMPGSIAIYIQPDTNFR